MTTSTFNAITYANKLKTAGLAVKVADVAAEELSDIIANNLATKDDLKMLEVRLQAFIVKALLTSITAIVGLLSIVHFIKI